MFIDWKGFTPEKAADSLPRLFEIAEAGFAKAEAAESAAWEDIDYALNDAMRPLCDAWGMVAHMSSVASSPGWRALMEEWQPKVVAFTLRVKQSKPIYEKQRKIHEAGVEDPVRRRILERALLSARLSGISLEGGGRERFNALSVEASQLSQDFRNAVLDATAAFKYEKGGKTYTIDDAEYPETMKHCADRDVRERLFRARCARAPENISRITRMLEIRRELAALLGFGSFAELSLAEKCAPSVAAVDAMIDALDSATAERAAEEAKELGPGLMPWDRAYAAERLRERKYEYSDADMRRHFELEDVLAGLWRVAKALFGVDVREVHGGPPAWHGEVRLFEVVDGGRVIAGFYLDPYVRNGEKQGGAWMNEFRNLCVRRGEKPLATIVTNFPRPDEGGKCRLCLREVETIFHEFGHALQCMLTEVREEDAAGISLVEWDAVELASQFMENWVLDPLAGFALPEDLKAKAKAAKNFMAATACRRQLAFASLDWNLHKALSGTDEKGVLAMQGEAFARFGIPTIEGDRFVCAFAHIFGGGYAAGYYSYKWAEIMSCDAYGAFEEAEPREYARIGSKFRATVLALGGSKSAYEVFRLFRGREPSIEPMLRQQGLIRQQ